MPVEGDQSEQLRASCRNEYLFDGTASPEGIRRIRPPRAALRAACRTDRILRTSRRTVP